MDGTATGILWTLTRFERPLETVPAVKSISNVQCVVKSAKLQEFV